MQLCILVNPIYYMDANFSKLLEMVKDREASPAPAAVHGVAKSQTQLSDWTIYDSFTPICNQRKITNGIVFFFCAKFSKSNV